MDSAGKRKYNLIRLSFIIYFKKMTAKITDRGLGHSLGTYPGPKEGPDEGQFKVNCQGHFKVTAHNIQLICNYNNSKLFNDC